MPKEIIKFKCDYCKKEYKHKSSALKHEKDCFYNPKNKACVSCGYNSGFGENGEIYCNARQVLIRRSQEMQNGKIVFFNDFRKECVLYKEEEV